MHILSPETDNCPILNQQKGENDCRKYFMINLHERMLPTSVGVEPVTSWSPVGRRIQMSHRGLYSKANQVIYSSLPILFVCVEVLRPSQPNGVMSSVVSLPNHTFTGQAWAWSSKGLTSIVHILSPETDNCPS